MSGPFKSTRREIISIADQKTISDHPELHHYTTEAGLIGILESNSIWATHFSDLNDATEVKLLHDPLVKALSNRFEKLVMVHQRGNNNIIKAVEQHGGVTQVAGELANDLVNALYSVTFDGAATVDIGTPFIASFCSHARDQTYEREHGLLSQWRGYGQDGGYCLVLDTMKLSELLVQELQSHYYIHLELSAARYAFDNISLEKLFPELLDRCNLFVSEMLKGNMAPMVQNGFAPFVAGATVFKHQGFREEREVRIVAMPGSQGLHDRVRTEHRDFSPMPIKKINMIKNNRGERRYISLFEGLEDKLPIKRVIVGPSRHQAANVERVHSLLGGNIAVKASATPFLQ